MQKKVAMAKPILAKNGVVSYIALGSNLDQPTQQIEAAFNALRKLPTSSLLEKSSLYQSEPMGPQDQQDYINAVVKLETCLSPIELLNALQAIENSQGRVRGKQQWGPRTLDLDILLYSDKTISTQRLTVPHYGMMQRAFVIFPLAEIEPDLVLPDNSRISEHAKTLSSQGIRKL